MKADLADKCEIAIAYAIGRAQPTAVNVDTFGTWATAPDRYIAEATLCAYEVESGRLCAYSCEKLHHSQHSRITSFTAVFSLVTGWKT